MLYTNIKKLEKYLRKYKFKPGFDSIILLKVSLHGFFSTVEERKKRKSKAKKMRITLLMVALWPLYMVMVKE